MPISISISMSISISIYISISTPKSISISILISILGPDQGWIGREEVKRKIYLTVIFFFSIVFNLFGEPIKYSILVFVINKL